MAPTRERKVPATEFACFATLGESISPMVFMHYSYLGLHRKAPLAALVQMAKPNLVAMFLPTFHVHVRHRRLTRCPSPPPNSHVKRTVAIVTVFAALAETENIAVAEVKNAQFDARYNSLR
jgi:hypothetical protein